MRGRLLTLAILLVVASFGTGCIIVGGASTPNYQNCDSTSVCRVGATCLRANLALPGQSAGSLCTDDCNLNGGVCPADPLGNLTHCVIVVDGGVAAGRCYRACGAGGSCGSGQTCATPPGMAAQVCIPGAGVAPQCGGSGQPCCTANACNSGLACSAGTCSACGGAGQACCAGSTCSAGLACAGTQCVAPPGAYEGCTSGSIGAACGGNTTCQRPMVANAGPNGWCTRACTGSASMCPASPIAGRSFNCYVLLGATGGQCYVDCPTGTEPCPTGTVCQMTDTMTATGVRICMPMPR